MSLLSRVLLVCIFVTTAFAQPRGADSVVSYAPGGGSGVFDPLRSLGLPRSQSGPSGFAGSDVTSLGEGGRLVLGFALPIVEGPGIDLIAYENPFEFPTGSYRTFCEVAFVEVSSDGVNFARFPSSYVGPQNPLNPFGSEFMGTYGGLCGGLPAFADVTLNAISPSDPVVSGGEAFDLQDLASHPSVLSGLVDLQAIRFVAFVDAVAGVDRDASGRLIYDHGGNPSSADIEAVVAVHPSTLQPAAAPSIALSYDALGRLQIAISDPNGLSDLDFTALKASLNYVPFSLLDLLNSFEVLAISNHELHARTFGPVQGQGVIAVFSVSIQDQSGQFSADQFFIQG